MDKTRNVDPSYGTNASKQAKKYSKVSLAFQKA